MKATAVSGNRSESSSLLVRLSELNLGIIDLLLTFLSYYSGNTCVVLPCERTMFVKIHFFVSSCKFSLRSK